MYIERFKKHGDRVSAHENCACTEMDGLELDLIQVWPAGCDFARTKELLVLLAEMYPARWSESSCFGRELTAQRLGRYLAHECGVFSRKNSKGHRGYCLPEIEEVAR